MKEKYWALFQQMKYNEFYLWHYQLRCKRVSGILDGLCIVATATSIASWGVWRQYPVVWSFIIAFAQIIAVLKPVLPFYKQLISCKYMLGDVKIMLTRMENDWLRIDTGECAEDEQIRELIFQYRSEYDNLDNRFIGDVYFAHVKTCDRRATEECERYFQLHYNV